MGDKSHIEWTDATWNPVVGCTRVSAGCDHCYAFQLHDQRHLAWKRGRWPDAPPQYHQPFSRVQLLPERLDQPLRWSRPRRIFVNSLSDLFHDDVPDAFIARVFAVMAATKQHAFQVLTKRPERMRALLASEDFEVAVDCQLAALAETKGWVCLSELDTWPLPNVWLGVSVEDQAAADERIPLLLQTPAEVRFLSCEPLLGPVDLRRWFESPAEQIARIFRAPSFGNVEPRRLDWVIAGGESGPHARPMHPDWARRLRDLCQAAGVSYFLKQWGEWVPLDQTRAPAPLDTGPRAGWPVGRLPDGQYVVRAGKHAAGRELDGRTWDEMPTSTAAVAP